MSIPVPIGEYARLMRLSNGPTAVADVWTGWAIATGTLAPSWSLAAATAASLCLYHSGMAMNDWSDARLDARERPERPLPSGRIHRDAARRLWITLMMIGAAAPLSLCRGGSFFPAFVSFSIALLVLAYNEFAKRTPAGPWVMGACRGLNLALGMTAAPLGEPRWSIVPGVVLYIAGVTLFSRDEADAPNRRGLMAALAVSLAGIGWLSTASWDLVASVRLPAAQTLAVAWAAATLWATRGMVAAVSRPSQANVGRGVGFALQGVVLIDACLALAAAGERAGAAVAALLPVTMLLARRIPQS